MRANRAVPHYLKPETQQLRKAAERKAENNDETPDLEGNGDNNNNVGKAKLWLNYMHWQCG